MRRFRRDYQFVYDHITHCTSPSRNSNRGDRQLSGDNAAAGENVCGVACLVLFAWSCVSH